MSSLLEQSLDEIIGSSRSSKSRVNKPARRNSRRRNGRHFRPVLHLNEETEHLAKGESYLRVSNLHPDLTEKDLGELFSRIGEIKFIKLEMNTRGQSTGVAFVGYTHPSDCSLAIDKFDGRRAAGQIICVENAVPLADRIFAASQRKPKKKNNRRREKKEKKKKQTHRKTAEELDAELSQYMSNEGQIPVAQDNGGANAADTDAPMDEPAAEQPENVPASQNAPANALTSESANAQNAPAHNAQPQAADERFAAVNNGE